jgi:hypothetical protein
MNLYQQRDIGEIFDAAHHFLKKNKQSYYTAFLYAGIPYLILTVIATILSQEAAMDFGDNPDPSQVLDLYAAMAPYFIPILLVSLITSIAFLVPFKMEDENKADTSEVYSSEFFRNIMKIVPLFLFMILFGIAVSLGTLLLIIPGIMIAVYCYLGYVGIIVHDWPVIDAFKSSYQLVKGRFWTTLGLFILLVLIYFVITLLFSLPTYVLMALSLFTGGEALIGFTIGNIIIQTIAALGNYFFSMYSAVVLGMTFYTYKAFQNKTPDNPTDSARDFEQI